MPIPTRPFDGFSLVHSAVPRRLRRAMTRDPPRRPRGHRAPSLAAGSSIHSLIHAPHSPHSLTPLVPLGKGTKSGPFICARASTFSAIIGDPGRPRENRCQIRREKKTREGEGKERDWREAFLLLFFFSLSKPERQMFGVMMTPLSSSTEPHTPGNPGQHISMLLSMWVYNLCIYIY